MISERQRICRNNNYVLHELDTFSDTGGLGSWNAYQCYMSTGSWENAKYQQKLSTLENDFYQEDYRYMEQVMTKYEVEEAYQEEEEIGFFDEEYETYEDYEDYDENDHSGQDDTSSCSSDEDEY